MQLTGQRRFEVNGRPTEGSRRLKWIARPAEISRKYFSRNQPWRLPLWVGRGREGGMIISRRPKIRASTENRPGPVPAMVSSMVRAKIADGVESNTCAPEGGKEASAAPAPPSA